MVQKLRANFKITSNSIGTRFCLEQKRGRKKEERKNVRGKEALDSWKQFKLINKKVSALVEIYSNN